jgi:hypothetical protein
LKPSLGAEADFDGKLAIVNLDATQCCGDHDSDGQPFAEMKFPARHSLAALGSSISIAR